MREFRSRANCNLYAGDGYISSIDEGKRLPLPGSYVILRLVLRQSDGTVL